MSTPTTIGDVIYHCHQWVPCGVASDLAIEAHQQAMRHPNETVRYHALRTVILAKTPDVETLRKRLDYLAGLDLSAWSGYEGGPPEELQRAVIDMLRRQIAMQTVHA